MVERIILKRVSDLEELVLDMVSTPEYILESVDWGSVKGTHHSYKYVNQVGVSITNTSLETREISIGGWVVASSENRMTELKKKLNSFVNPQEEMNLFYSSYVITFKPDSTVRYSINKAENNEIMCKFKIEGTCPNPLFSDNEESNSTFANTTPLFHFPLILSRNLPERGLVFGRRTNSLIANVANKGSVSVGMRIVFVANGAVKNPSLININTQEKFVINKQLVATERVEINTNIGEKRIKGKIGSSEFINYFMYKDVDSPWLQLSVGNNQFRYDAEEGLENLDVFVYFSNKYLEVQECY